MTLDAPANRQRHRGVRITLFSRAVGGAACAIDRLLTGTKSGLERLTPSDMFHWFSAVTV
jgi:hypothetical protein